MKILSVVLILLLLNGVLSDGDLQRQWNAWKLKYQKKYSGKEDQTRFKTWLKNLKKVEEHNKLFEVGETTFTMEMNEFAAMTKLEFQKMLMPDDSASISESNRKSGFFFNQSAKEPTTVDWTQENCVTPVKNQGQLGSCYSFSSVEAVEGQYSLQTGKLISFSEQQVVDCDQGGDGGLPYKVYQYLISCGGVETEADYPYTAQVGNCQFDKRKAVATLQSYRFIRPFKSETALKSAVSSVGPISVSSIEIFESFQLYKSGVYYEPLCKLPDPSMSQYFQGYHAMLATGYGTDSDGNEYWSVKNSWGTRWGEKGYILMSRNRDNNCGIASAATYPILTSNQPAVGADQGGAGFKELPSAVAMFFVIFLGFMLRSV